MRILGRLVLFSSLVALLASCTESSRPNIELIKDMMVSPAYKAQDVDEEGKSSMRTPPENTVAIGHKRYPYGPGDVEKAARELKNPMAGKVSVEILDRGKERYDIYCGICHGMTGKGDGTVAAKMPLRPPSLVTSKARGFSDGKYYHIIVQGQGVMGSYANQLIKEDDRWAVINYIRSLQKLAN